MYKKETGIFCDKVWRVQVLNQLNPFCVNLDILQCTCGSLYNHVASVVVVCRRRRRPFWILCAWHDPFAYWYVPCKLIHQIGIEHNGLLIVNLHVDCLVSKFIVSRSFSTFLSFALVWITKPNTGGCLKLNSNNTVNPEIYVTILIIHRLMETNEN
jgi:hypothetical protein